MKYLIQFDIYRKFQGTEQEWACKLRSDQLGFTTAKSGAIVFDTFAQAEHSLAIMTELGYYKDKTEYLTKDNCDFNPAPGQIAYSIKARIVEAG
jgi:hypothetical protein